MSDVTVTTEPPLANSPEARTTDGTIVDRSTIPTPTPTPTPEPKPEPPKVEGDAPKPEVQGGAPEKYTDFTLPEGLTIEPKAIEAAQVVFKDLGLSQASAQKLVDFHAKNLLESQQAPYKTWADTQRQWQDEITARFGDRVDQIRGDINSAIATALPPSLAKSMRTAMDTTGAGSNPDIVEALSILLRPHFEGKPVVGGRPSPEANKAPDRAQLTPAEAIYGHLRK